MTKSLPEWLEFISKTHHSEIELGLTRIQSVFSRLPHNSTKAKVVLVAGTNGKGSTIAMLEASLLALGYNVGAYTSPHILNYNERIRINAQDVKDDELIQSFEVVESARHETALTYFEYGTLAALNILFDKDLDVVLLEVGLGGRLDAVNIVEPDLCIITSVALDHTAWLGETVDLIGAEKAGILRSKCLFVGGENLPDSVYKRSQALSCQYLACRTDFDVSKTNNLFTTHLINDKQVFEFSGFPNILLPENNILVALQATLTLFELLTVNEVFTQCEYERVIKAIECIDVPGRLEHVIRTQDHNVFLDVGHNPHAAMYLNDFLMQYSKSGALIQIVYSSLSDKDSFGVLKCMNSVVDHCVLTQLTSDRSMSLTELTNLARESNIKDIVSFDDTHEALQHALDYPQIRRDFKGKFVTLIFGSFFMVEAAKRFLETYD